MKYESLTNWQQRSTGLVAGDYANEGEPDAVLSITQAENPSALAEDIADILNALEGIEDPAAWIKEKRQGKRRRPMAATAELVMRNIPTLLAFVLLAICITWSVVCFWHGAHTPGAALVLCAGVLAAILYAAWRDRVLWE